LVAEVNASVDLAAGGCGRQEARLDRRRAFDPEPSNHRASGAGQSCTRLAAAVLSGWAGPRAQTGFCNQHDTELFRPLDTKPFDGADREQLFLLACRGITCELHSIMTGVVQLQSLYTARVDRGADSPDSSGPAGQKAVEQMLLSWATSRYGHSYYDEPLLRRSFDGVEHDVIDLNEQAPCLAASSFIAVKDVLLNEEVVGVAINILPVSETRTVVAFSFAGKDRGIVRAALERVLGSTG
jgi:hypothetical protein